MAVNLNLRNYFRVYFRSFYISAESQMRNAKNISGFKALTRGMQSPSVLDFAFLSRNPNQNNDLRAKPLF